MRRRRGAEATEPPTDNTPRLATILCVMVLGSVCWAGLAMRWKVAANDLDSTGSAQEESTNTGPTYRSTAGISQGRRNSLHDTTGTGDTQPRDVLDYLVLDPSSPSVSAAVSAPPDSEPPVPSTNPTAALSGTSAGAEQLQAEVSVGDPGSSTSSSRSAGSDSPLGPMAASNTAAIGDQGQGAYQPPNRAPGECSIDKLAEVLAFNDRTARWEPTPQADSWCSGVKFPIEGKVLVEKFRSKMILFLGDSVVRNMFVLTAAKICNEKRLDKCITRMPTPPFGEPDPANKGPWGCIPRDDPEYSKEAMTSCYRDSSFVMEPIPSLTAPRWPQTRSERIKQVRKGAILPALKMSMPDNITLVYLGVTHPKQIGTTGRYLGWKAPYFQDLAAIFVSIGPHLKMPELMATPTSLPSVLQYMRANVPLSMPIAAAEFVPAVGTDAEFDKTIDGLLDTIREKLTGHNVSLVPQRVVTKHRYVQGASDVPVTDKQELEGIQQGKREMQCGYYDAQHPALRCQAALTELMLAAVIKDL